VRDGSAGARSHCARALDDCAGETGDRVRQRSDSDSCAVTELANAAIERARAVTELASAVIQLA